MTRTEELIQKIHSLSPDQIDQVLEFVDELDNDIGLEEDLAECDRILCEESQSPPQRLKQEELLEIILQ